MQSEGMGNEVENDVITHMCPPSGSGVMPCCGLPPFERLSDRMTSDPELVSCWFLDDIAAAEADLKTGRVKTLEQLRLALVGSSDIILIVKDADGDWPKKVRQTVASAIGQAASTERRGELTPEVFLAIQTRLLNELAALAEEAKWTIRWCIRHQSSVNPYDDDDSQCIVATCVVGVMSQCRMVTATVSIPHDAGLIPTIPHPPALVERITNVLQDAWGVHTTSAELAVVVLDALALIPLSAPKPER